MSSNITTYDPANATLLQMRADPVNFPRLKTIPKVEAYAEMRKVVTEAYLYKGNSADSSHINFVATSLVDELLADTKWGAGNISLGEIRKVVKRAVLETDLPAISVATLYKVIMDFVKGEGHLNQKKVEEMTADDLTDFVGIFNAIKQGESRVEDWFKTKAAPVVECDLNEVLNA